MHETHFHLSYSCMVSCLTVLMPWMSVFGKSVMKYDLFLAMINIVNKKA